ncbi:MAG: transcriptional regulator [Pseudomonadota bacterium]
MDIQTYLSKTGLSQSELARRLKVCQPTVNDWVHGRKYPSPENARQLVKLSGGKVTLADIYGKPKAA